MYAVNKNIHNRWFRSVFRLWQSITEKGNRGKEEFKLVVFPSTDTCRRLLILFALSSSIFYTSQSSTEHKSLTKVLVHQRSSLYIVDEYKP
jgi:hypothetical protein